MQQIIFHWWFEHQKRKSRWWFQPIWKICSSNWVHLPQVTVGVNMKNIWNHHREIVSPHIQGGPPLARLSWNGSHGSRQIVLRFGPAIDYFMMDLITKMVCKKEFLFKYGGWTNPIWKILSSNWIISTGVKIKNMGNHHLVFKHGPVLVLKLNFRTTTF